MASGATALDFLFGGLTITTNPQYQRKNMDFCGQNRLFPEIDVFSAEANNQYLNIVIIVIIIVVIIVVAIVLQLVI